MERVSSKVFLENVIDMTDDASKSTAFVGRAVENAKLKRTTKTIRKRNRSLAVDLRTQHLDRVGEEVIATLAQTGDIAKAQAKIAEISQLTRNRSGRIGAWETDTINTEITRQYQAAAGIKSYTWQTQQDDRVRPEHAAREGKVFEWSKPPEDGHPGEPPNCSCRAEPTLPAELTEG